MNAASKRKRPTTSSAIEPVRPERSARIVPPQHSVVTPGAPASATSTSTMGVTTVHPTPELAIRRASWTHVRDMSR